MEGPPDEEPRSGPTEGKQRPETARAKPNLWILVGITLLSLLMTAAVLLLTALSP